MSNGRQRRVMLGTPCVDGRPEAWYMHSVMETKDLCAQHGIIVKPVLMSYDAMIQRARNDILKLALESGYDDLLFIDDDEIWKPEWALALIRHPVDVVGAPVRKKSDEQELYNVKVDSPFVPIDCLTGLCMVESVGTGFIRLSRKAMLALWDACESEEYEDNGKINRMVFNVAVVNRRLVSEDTFMCMRLKAAGFKVYVDASFTITHIGPKHYKGEFAAFVNGLQRKALGSAA